MCLRLNSSSMQDKLMTSFLHQYYSPPRFVAPSKNFSKLEGSTAYKELWCIKLATFYYVAVRLRTVQFLHQLDLGLFPTKERCPELV